MYHLFPEWKGHKICFERLQGLTNMIFKLSISDQSISPNKLIGRVFGKLVENIFTYREQEHIIYT